jgi:hypothetical protein
MDLDPLAFISQPIIIQTGATGILVLVIISILRGWLVPRAVLVDRMKDKDDIIARQQIEIERWVAAHTTSEAGRAELKDQNSKLIAGQESQNRFIDEFHRYFGTRENLRQIEGGDH